MELTHDPLFAVILSSDEGEIHCQLGGHRRPAHA